jgi:DNA-binding Xre family transcriptional regulator
MSVLTIDQLRAKLQDRRLEIVANATGLHYNTLLCIRDSKQTNVKYETLEKLSAYFLRDLDVKISQ